MLKRYTVLTCHSQYLDRFWDKVFILWVKGPLAQITGILGLISELVAVAFFLWWFWDVVFAMLGDLETWEFWDETFCSSVKVFKTISTKSSRFEARDHKCFDGLSFKKCLGVVLNIEHIECEINNDVNNVEFSIFIKLAFCRKIHY